MQTSPVGTARATEFRATSSPRVVLICHAEDRLDREGVASWLAATCDLVGLVVIEESRWRRVRRVRNEWKRSGVLGLLDVLAFQLFYRLRLARRDAAWIAREVGQLRARYPADLSSVPTCVVETPNSEESRRFLTQARPDLVIARCKFILKREIFAIPRGGTFALHPGICPEYRNAHGCFWALANRDLQRVGMTMLRIDAGVDTGPMFLQASCSYDERAESHVVIQHRAVIANLEAIRQTLVDVLAGRGQAIPALGRSSAVWGQPRLSAYRRWKRAARRETR
jgi:folate-dependent phosphoribosylglycinamide formyltransferase PurN